MSVNIELPSENSLKLLAPEKKKEDIFTPMKLIKNGISSSLEERRKFKSSPVYVPAGQSTQLIIGATNDSDLDILKISEKLYSKYSLKRVYYSAYVPVNKSNLLPDIQNPPTLREHRLYQGDWLLRIYGFKADELLNTKVPNFDINFDPKTTWALNNLHLFPIEINTAPYDMLIRIPGIGIRGAKKIVSCRKIASLTYSDLKKLGVVLKRAQYFITCRGKYHGLVDLDEDKIKRVLSPAIDLNQADTNFEQLSLFSKNSERILNPNLLLPNDTVTALTGEL
jgi:putative DNA modification/repair radical SAM protein